MYDVKRLHSLRLYSPLQKQRWQWQRAKHVYLSLGFHAVRREPPWTTCMLPRVSLQSSYSMRKRSPRTSRKKHTFLGSGHDYFLVSFFLPVAGPTARMPACADCAHSGAREAWRDAPAGHTGHWPDTTGRTRRDGARPARGRARGRTRAHRVAGCSGHLTGD